MFSSTNSSYSSSISSGPHSPYQHPQPTSSLSVNSQRRRNPMPAKYPRFYASPLDEGTDSTPLQVYGYEQREPSIYGKPPKLLHRVSHVLGDIREDFTLQLDPLKRRSTVFFETPISPASPEVPMTSDGPRSRPMSIISYDAIAAPSRRLSQRLTRRLSVFSSRGKPTGHNGASISSPNLIGSSNQYGNRSQISFI
ncbi:hypothetical protein PENARI_c016G03399 [Penicillium arizonense]|uniref:Uncharacterized protein n=1 Tax=Penicillium arizonense TaxID=1835702 RepID=A0A1F5LBB0_PENAI|nr:hypothetical protein PENARI_c016G03399 [Penicillium arizonense]OGE50513.1 hypothetical protein PENARI_c016G03399 [Penicillium arizonense]